MRLRLEKIDLHMVHHFSATFRVSVLTGGEGLHSIKPKQEKAL